MISRSSWLDRTLVIIPVRNEAATLGTVIQALQAQGLTRIRVVDNGSRDRSADCAKAAGAEVVSEPLPGYGQACWTGLQQLPPDIEWILFCDGDGSDDLSQLAQFFQCDRVDLILGDRRATAAGQAALTPVQNFGNELATTLIRWGWGYRYRDLGPLRLIRRSALEQMQMRDRGFGWTVEMQIRAVELGLRICELPVDYKPRQAGQSKISGTISGSIQAGTIILSTIAQLYWRRSQNHWVLSSGVLLLLGSGLASPHGDFRQAAAVPLFLIGMAVMNLGFALSWRIGAIGAGGFWTVTLLARGLLLPMYPSDDVWRYLWEGHIQTLGFSPYELAPNAAELVPYRTDWWGLINHMDVSAIYPPIAQLGFWALASITPAVWLFKLAFVAADLAICGLLSRRFGYSRTLLYAWNPLVIYSFAGAAHYDSWFLLPLVATWLSLDRVPSLSLQERDGFRQPLTGVLLVGISVAVKWMSLPVLGFLVWRSLHPFSFKTVLRAAIVLLAGLLPFAIATLFFCRGTTCPLIPTDSVFVSHGRSAEWIPYLVSLVWEPSRWANWIYAFPLSLALLWLMVRARSLLDFIEGYLFFLLILSPIVHVWYFTWLMPFAVASRNWGVRLASLCGLVYFLLPYRQAIGNPNWFLTFPERFWLWMPFILGWLGSVWWAGRQAERG